MTYTSIFEKLLLVFNIVKTSWVYIAFTFVAFLLLILLVLKKLSKKTCFILTSMATSLVLGYTVYIYYEEVSKLVSSIVDNLFLNIYFPSAYAYLFVLVLVNVSAIITLLNPKGEKVYKTINGVCLVVTDFILALILEVIATNGVNVFEKASIFTNKTLVTLLELGINTFILWIVSLVVVYLINMITERIMIARENKKLVSEPATILNTDLAISEPVTFEDYQVSVNDEENLEEPIFAFETVGQNKFIPNFTVSIKNVAEEETTKFIPNFSVSVKEVEDVNEVIPTTYASEQVSSYDNVFDLSAFIPKNQEVKPINSFDDSISSSQIFSQVLNEVKEENVLFEDEVSAKDMYTLNDYRIFNNMLKDIKEHNQDNSILIDKNLEYRLITKYSNETYDMFKDMLKIYSN